MLLKSWLHRLVRTVRNDRTASRRPGATGSRYQQRTEHLEQRTMLTLTVSIDMASIAETDGAMAATGTVSRAGEDNTNPLTLQLRSSNPQEATVPASITIPLPGSNNIFEIVAHQIVTATSAIKCFKFGHEKVRCRNHSDCSVTR